MFYSKKNGFNGYNYLNWRALSTADYPEVWWVQNNLSRSISSKDEEAAILNELARRFQAKTITGFGKQDAGIRLLKNKWMGQDDYDYRVLLYRFTNP